MLNLLQLAAVVANVVFTNGHVITVAADVPRAEAIAVKGADIVYVGSNQGAQAFVGKGTRVVDLHGQAVLPGFHDSHVHLIDGGVESTQCDLSACTSQDEIFATIEKYAREHPHDAWIRGGGWSLPLFVNTGPTKEKLDKIVPDRPAYLESQDHHSAWVNSAALKKAGITADTANPTGGRFERRPDKEPSGTLRESAMGALSDVLPTLAPKDYDNGLRIAQKKALAFGITATYDAAADESLLAAYTAAARRKELKLKITAALRTSAEHDEKQVKGFVALRKKYDSDRVHVRAAKIFADGVIEAKTAAMLKPYELTSRAGDLNFTKEALSKLVPELAKNDFQVHIHAIGDRGVRTALDALEEAKDVSQQKDLRNHIAHLELIDAQDIPRFKQLGVIANFQAFWAQRDGYIKDLTEPFIGPERSKHLYPMAPVKDTGATMAGGSDWPVSSLNPLDAIEVAVTRCATGDSSGATRLPGDPVDLQTMLAAYTINGAKVAHADKERGSLEVGKRADLIILDHDPFAVPPHKIHEIKVVETMIDGQTVFQP